MLKRVEQIKKGESSANSRKTAEQLLASAKVSNTHRRRVQAVVKSASYFRETPTLRFEVDPRTYLFLSDQPDVTVSLWRAMNISKFKLDRKDDDGFSADGGDGTKGEIEILHQTPQHQIVFCKGAFKSPMMLTSIKTESVIHLQTQFSKGKDGRFFATHRAFIHVAFPSSTVEAVAKVLSPVGNAVLDRNFQEISLFVHVMSIAMAKQPGWIEHVAGRMDGISDDQKKALLKVTARVFYAARKRETIPLFKTRKEYLEEIMRPLQVERTADAENKSGTN